MVVYRLEQRWEILRHYFENHCNVAECMRKLRTDFGRREVLSAPYVRYLVIKDRHYWDEFCKRILLWRYTKFSCFRSWSQLIIQCVFAALSAPAIDLQKIPILTKKQNNPFRWTSFWSSRTCKQEKMSHLGYRKPIHWKAGAPKTSHCLVRILVQRHNWVIFLRKWARRGRYSQWRSLSGHVERIFVHKNWRGGYWQHLVLTGQRYVQHSRNYTRCLAPCFWRSHYHLQSWCRFATSKLRFNVFGLFFVGCQRQLTL